MPVLMFGGEAVSVYAAPPAPQPKPAPAPQPAAAPAPPRPAPAPQPVPSSHAPSLSQITAELRGQPVASSAAQAQAKQSAAAEAVGAAVNVKGAPLTAAESSAAATAGAAAVQPGTQATQQGLAAAAAAGVEAVPGEAGAAGGGLVRTGMLNHAEIEKLWLAAGGAREIASIAADIAECESRGDTSAIDNTVYPSKPGYHRPGAGASPEYSIGLWQVNVYAHPQYSAADMLDGYLNAKAIVAISDNGKDFAHSNTHCYQLVTGTEPGQGAFPVTPSGEEGVEPPAVATAWGNLLDVLGKKVPAGLASITSNADALKEIFK